ncbi:MAG: tRNA pseudouridine(55) synthase TruB [Crocinitomix sp.]|nr:tRNA pseudouridine(55) synthase TruB [Crocinitomix sp.]|tara:strand:- start:9 stop:725 length:717 start_codon:yes stop_codon:yes gene_type:complete
MKTLYFQAGEVILVNKPLHWTSFDVVNKLRYELKQKLGIKKIKVGHAGTLDPLADGLLILCTGKKTKEIESFMGLEKKYSGTITLGSTTPSYDLETEIDHTFPLDKVTENQVKAEVEKMVGTFAQQPPIFSAKKVKGKKAYDLARAGKEVKLEPKVITIHSFELSKIELPLVYFEITCSKGTYIRSIASDLGKSLGNGGYLSALRREKIGPYHLKDAHSVKEWVEIIQTSDMNNNPSI